MFTMQAPLTDLFIAFFEEKLDAEELAELLKLTEGVAN